MGEEACIINEGEEGGRKGNGNACLIWEEEKPPAKLFFFFLYNSLPSHSLCNSLNIYIYIYIGKARDSD